MRAGAKAAATLAFALVATSARAQAPDILLYRGADRQQRLIEGATKEGEVNFFSAMIVNQALRPVAAAFQKKYPGVKLNYWRGDSEDIAVKLSAESRAGNLVADVVEGTGIGEMTVRAGFAEQSWSPMIEELPERLRDPRMMWAPTRMSYFGMAYNTRLVSKADAPKSYDDLLDPRWRGKIAWPATASSAAPLFVTNLRLAWGEDRALAYLRRLAEQKIVNFGSGNARVLVDRVIAGDYPLALAIFAHHPLISAGKGAPVATGLLPPVASAAGTMAVPRGVKHPNAAMLLMDFVLSREGQGILAAAEYLPSRADVDPLPQIAPIVPSRAGVEENFIAPEKYAARTESSTKIIEDLFR
jgi:ABC-type Fe3+ transport system substrate-binding protein